MSPPSIPAPTYGEPLQRALFEALTGKIEPVRISWGYRLGLFVVALAMLALPLIYLAIIGAVAYGLYFYVTFLPTALSQIPSARVRVLAVAGPLVIGGVVLLFLIKPLLARPPRPASPLQLSRRSEPVLFAFVDRLAELVGAPKPREIRVDSQVNASAGFRRAFGSLWGQDLTLTLGLPLAAGLTLPQLAGVLAHEFGHFGQRAGLRVSHVILTVNHWFYRVVYERDAWDTQLDEAARKSDFRIAFVLHIARGGVWTGRKVLHLLMLVGHGLSCFLLRHMEYDADRYQTRLVGPQVFEETVRNLLILDAAHRQSLADLANMWEEGRLGDDLCRLVQANRERIEPRVMPAVRQHLETSKTGTFHTHPANRDRIANARRETGAPVFDSPLPGTVLFRDFSALSHRVSRHFYETALGESIDPKSLVSTEEVVIQQDRARADQEALARLLPAGVHPSRPLPLTDLEPPSLTGEADAGESEELPMIRAVLSQRAETLAARLEEWLKMENRRLRALQAEVLLGVGFHLEPQEFHLPKADPAGVDRARTVAVERKAALDAELQAGEQLQAQCLRLALCASLSATPESGAEIRGLWDLAARLGELDPRLTALREHFTRLHILASQLPQYPEAEDLRAQVAKHQRATLGALTELVQALQSIPRPAGLSGDGPGLGPWAVPTVPQADDLGAIYGAAEGALHRLMELYLHTLGRLADLAERAETAATVRQRPAELSLPHSPRPE